MRLFAIVAAMAVSQSPPVPPLQVTPIEQLGAGNTRHVELLQVRRDFGKPNVNIAIDAWIAPDARSIHTVRVWWSDAIDRYPFNARVQRRVRVAYRALGPQKWQISVVGDEKRFLFDVELRGRRPVLFT